MTPLSVRLILLPWLLLAPAALSAMGEDDSPRYRLCRATIQHAPASAIAMANGWIVEGGGAPARHCLGLAYLADARPAAAATAFENAAKLAEASGQSSAPDYWTQAGNAALMADDAARAQLLFDKALAAAPATYPLRADMLIDRARAAFELDQPAATRRDLDAALALQPDHVAALLLRATLARLDQRLTDAATDIGRAVSIAPDDADVQLERGNIALMQNDPATAESAWRAAVAAAPDSPAGQAAAQALASGGVAPGQP